MIIRCGYWIDKFFSWRWERRKKKYSHLREWHEFFPLLYPREVGLYDCRILETIMRRKIFLDGRYGRMEYWQYRAKTIDDKGFKK